MSNFTVGSTGFTLGTITEEDEAAALACLTRHDAGDLAEMLGLA